MIRKHFALTNTQIHLLIHKMQLPLAMSTKRINIVQCFNYPIRLRIRLLLTVITHPSYCILSCLNPTPSPWWYQMISVDTIQGRYESSLSVQVKYKTLWLFVSTFDTKSLYYIWKRWTCEIYWISFETLCLPHIPSLLVWGTHLPLPPFLTAYEVPGALLHTVWQGGWLFAPLQSVPCWCPL